MSKGRNGRSDSAIEKPEKHIPFFSLIRSMKSDSCPICRMVQGAVAQYFDNLLYENVNDQGFRKSFDRNRGLCNRHAHQLAGLHDGLAVGIIYRNTLDSAARALESGGALPLHSGRCAICEYESETESHALATLASFIDDDQLREAFDGSAGLCLPHLAAAQESITPLPDWFRDLHRERYRKLLADLDRYLDFCNFSLGDKRPELAPEEQLVWAKVVAMLIGYQGMPQAIPKMDQTLAGLFRRG